jgi:S-formylglutathione hydrolase FrmB
MRLTTGVVLLILWPVLPVQAQLRSQVNLDRLNRRLSGRVIDYTHNHGVDRRIYSPILGQKRDLYVYVPPGYSPCRSYSLILYLHTAYVDETSFVASQRIFELDEKMRTGAVPPALVVIPDGLIEGLDRRRSPHSFFINGRFGRFEDHLLYEVLPFVHAHYPVRPDRQSRAILGASAGGFGAASIALRHPEIFGSVATVGAPLNLRYSTCRGDTLENFSPMTYRWKRHYDPDEIVGKFYFGLKRVHASKYISPVFGDDPPGVSARIRAVNPADVLLTTRPRPGYPAMYVNYGGRDNWNFDAEAESFLWLARLQGFPVDAEVDPAGRHNLRYFRDNHAPAFLWLARHLAPPSGVTR